MIIAIDCTLKKKRKLRKESKMMFITSIGIDDEQ
jgi:hypothetical protein